MTPAEHDRLAAENARLEKLLHWLNGEDVDGYPDFADYCQPPQRYAWRRFIRAALGEEG